jgi:uncharacterized protein (DUF2141 family)
MDGLLLFFQLAFMNMSQSAEPRHDLIINIAHINDTQHPIYIAVNRKSDGFPNTPDVVKYVALDPSGKNSAIVSISGIPYGKYAITIFQDMNGNKKLDKGFLGIPSEPIAFSNDFHPLFGPPRWKDCEFDYSESLYTVNISKLLKL